MLFLGYLLTTLFLPQQTQQLAWLRFLCFIVICTDQVRQLHKTPSRNPCSHLRNQTKAQPRALEQFRMILAHSLFLMSSCFFQSQPHELNCVCKLLEARAIIEPSPAVITASDKHLFCTKKHFLHSSVPVLLSALSPLQLVNCIEAIYYKYYSIYAMNKARFWKEQLFKQFTTLKKKDIQYISSQREVELRSKVQCIPPIPPYLQDRSAFLVPKQMASIHPESHL